MSPSPLSATESLAASPWLVAGGVGFIIVWLLLSAGWIIMSGMANLMANDSGSASPQKHMRLILAMLVGQLIAAGAGIPGGLAFFWLAHRHSMIEWFVILLVAGIGIQALAFWSFFKRS